MPNIFQHRESFQSRKTFQIKCLPKMTVDGFKRDVEALARVVRISSEFGVGLAVNADEKSWIGTVSCPTENIKKDMMRQAGQQWKDSGVSDSFSNLTILHAPPEDLIPEADICLVHGLGGNAIDSFAFDPSPNGSKLPILWPRDLLAKRKEFETTRIMTYGYNSSLFDGGDKTTMRDWYKNLLKALETLRNPNKPYDIPLILLGYSLGGLVVREALADILNSPEVHKILVNQCGAIFLGTPHHGSSAADWNNISISLGCIFDLRKELVDHLKTFSDIFLMSQQVWLRERGIYRLKVACFCEARETKLGIGSKMIVKKGSAGFMGLEATTLDNTDHHSICKFHQKTDDNFKIIASTLCNMIGKIRSGLARGETEYWGIRHNIVPGDPLAVSPYTPIKPLPYVIGGSPSELGFFGREKELENLKLLLDHDLQEPGEPILITGIGGIGKTELALQVAQQGLRPKDPKNSRHVIFLRASELDASYEYLAGIFNFEILLVSQSPEFIEQSWATKSSLEKGQAFKFWLEKSEDSKIIIIDDADARFREAIRDLAIPRGGRTLIITTRNPFLLLRSKRRMLQLDSMQTRDVVELIEALNGDYHMGTDEQLEKIGDVLGNHPLAVRNAVEFIIRYLIHDRTQSPIENFLESFSSSEDQPEKHQARRDVLNTKVTHLRSVLDCFDISMKEIHSDGQILISLISFAGFLTSETQKNDFREFFYKIIPRHRDLMEDLREQLDDYELLSLPTTNIGKSKLGKYIDRLIEFSILTLSDGRMEIHKLWIECIRQLAEKEGRVRYVKQIILICDTILYKSPAEKRNETRGILLPYISTCYKVLQDFGMSFDQVKPPYYRPRVTLKSYMVYWRFQQSRFDVSKLVKDMGALSTAAKSLHDMDKDDIRLSKPRQQLINMFSELRKLLENVSRSKFNVDDLDNLKAVVNDMNSLSFLAIDNFRFKPTLAEWIVNLDQKQRQIKETK